MAVQKKPEPRLMAPTDYARKRGMKPQLVYYYVRTGKFNLYDCECGRPVIDVKEADEFFKGRKESSNG